jgi:hypothetical protein
LLSGVKLSIPLLLCKRLGIYFRLISPKSRKVVSRKSLIFHYLECLFCIHKMEIRVQMLYTP